MAQKLSERDICTKFITPAIQKAGWDIQTQVREEVSFTNGRIIVRGKLHSRGERKRADYILYYKSNIPIAIIEAKDNSYSYCLLLDTPKFVESKFNEIEPRSILQKGDYLMNIVGASIGRTAVFDRDDVANINQAVCLIRVGYSELSKAFLLHFFNSETCLGYMFDKQVDNARPNLSMGNIAKFLIPIPPVNEQHRIVSKVDALMALCDQLKARIQQANQQQQTLADALVAQAVA